MFMNVTDFELAQFGTSHDLWLEEDITPVFAAKYWTDEFCLGFIIIIIVGIVHVLCYTYFRPFSYDMAQKLIKLEAMNLDPYLKKDIKHVLSPYIDHNLDVMDIIFEFSAISNNMNSVMEYLNSIMSSNIAHSPLFLFRRFCWNLFVWSLISITYTLLYHPMIFIIDSNRSFTQVPCQLAFDTSCTVLHRLEMDDKDEDEDSEEPKVWQKCMYQFDLSEYFDQINATESYMFYGEVYMTRNETTTDNYTDSVFCSINKDTMKYRYLDEGEEAGFKMCHECRCCRRKCGRCRDHCYDEYECSCCDDNCFLLCCSIATGIIVGIFGFSWLLMSEFFIKDGYWIDIKEKI